MERLKYCDKKGSNTSHCSKIAVFQSMFIPKSNKESGTIVVHERCAKHEKTATQSKVFYKSEPHDQAALIKETQLKLATYINKDVFSTFHRNKHPYLGKYIKDCGIMCQQTNNGKWIYVYSHQIQNF